MYVIEKLKRSNSRSYTPVLELETIKDVTDYMARNGLKHAKARDPYVFSYIPLSDGSIVTQYAIVGSDQKKMACSPLSLRAEIENNEKAKDTVVA